MEKLVQNGVLGKKMKKTFNYSGLLAKSKISQAHAYALC